MQEKFKLSFAYFENNMEYEAFAPQEQMLHIPYYFQKALLWSKRLVYQLSWNGVLKYK